ncbi:MAG: DUF4926 domain-containing protein [Chloroflexi bacterium]|nr:DUF4926 domain-containing protein [Chloroflexota bacterium]
MTKAKRYDTVVLREEVGGFQAGEVGAVVEVYTTPYEAYDVEIVTNDGETKGLVEGLRPDQIDLTAMPTERSGAAARAGAATQHAADRRYA